MSDVLAVRFPNRETEYLLGSKLDVGDTLTRAGEEWIVTSVEADANGVIVATVRPADVSAHMSSDGDAA